MSQEYVNKNRSKDNDGHNEVHSPIRYRNCKERSRYSTNFPHGKDSNKVFMPRTDNTQGHKEQEKEHKPNIHKNIAQNSNK